MDRRWRADVIPAPNCPRCASSNTKFCYYNNYSLSQPRFFCKGCKRYWTKGGSLRSIPVGGGCRKRRSRSTKVSSSSPNSSSDCSEKLIGPDIDMAAIFAKFLNYNQGNLRREINGAANTTSSEGSHDSLTSSSCGLENGFDSQIISGDFFVPEHNQLQEEGAVQGLLNLDLACFDDIIGDVFWSDDSNISSLTWQPVPQSEEFNPTSLPVHQYDVSTDRLSTNNWSCFDNSEFEALS
ncbi:uncharacterized protein LOC141605414 [Silene latifolia]|uniref:uncharacterized protein LOC141605414 n=1 Tax=Silene latifolia TaxID=37657 RepID=UPI003D7858BC